MEQKLTFLFAGHEATVWIPENANGRWIWKTEFFTAFDKAEQDLYAEGYIRVYYCISDMYGSFRAVRLMHEFQKHLMLNYGLVENPVLFGFSRGGLYAFNYALFYPECVSGVYLDAPVLDLKDWPQPGIPEHTQMLEEYGINDQALFGNWHENPIDRLEEYFSLGLPTLVVAGDADEAVDFTKNAGKLQRFCSERGLPLTGIVKPGCGHHPHSLEDDTAPIRQFVNDCFDGRL